MTNWQDVHARLNAEGYAVLTGLLGSEEIRELRALGDGELQYLPRELPPFLQRLRDSLYRRLAPIANEWAETLGEPQRFPAKLGDYLARNECAGQTRALSHMTRLREGGHEALHQHADDYHVFPLQLAGLLSDPRKEFGGGEFLMVEQRPRMQSRPIVVPLLRGDLAVITTAERPQKGAKGYYRVRMKHAVSRVLTGERRGVEILFHDSAQQHEC